MFSNFFKGKTVLVTGHTGFKGSWISIWLNKLGANVIGYSLAPNTSPSLYEITNIDSKIQSYINDLRNIEKLEEVIQKHRPEIIIHMAAQALVVESYKRPKETFEVNIIGLVNLLEVIRKCNFVKVFLNVTSDKCYENKEWIFPYRENDPLGGKDPYSASKACSEIITQSYRHSFFLNDDNKKEKKDAIAIITARAGNVIGGGDWSTNRLIPDIVRAITSSKPIIIRNPSSIRPWQHVLEPLSGYLQLIENAYHDPVKYSEAWNFGPPVDAAISVQKLTEKIIKIWGIGQIKYESGNISFTESRQLRLDWTKVNSQLGWKPRLGLEKSIEFTVDWYRNYYENNESPFLNCIRQIENYENIYP